MAVAVALRQIGARRAKCRRAAPGEAVAVSGSGSGSDSEEGNHGGWGPNWEYTPATDNFIFHARVVLIWLAVANPLPKHNVGPSRSRRFFLI